MNSGGRDTRTRFVLRLVVKQCLFITEGYVAAADILSLRDKPLIRAIRRRIAHLLREGEGFLWRSVCVLYWGISPRVPLRFTWSR